MENFSPALSCPAWVSHHGHREFQCLKWREELPGWWGSRLILFSSLDLSLSKESKSMGSDVAKQKLWLPRGKVHVPELTLTSRGASQPLGPLGCPDSWVPHSRPHPPSTPQSPVLSRASGPLQFHVVPCCSIYLKGVPITPSLDSIQPSAGPRWQPRLPPVAIPPCQAGSWHPGLLDAVSGLSTGQSPSLPHNSLEGNAGARVTRDIQGPALCLAPRRLHQLLN